MPFDTRITRMLGVEHPIVQGGMHFVAYAGLAAAVSNAGGLGTITALTQPSPEALRAEIAATRALLKSPTTPFAVNLTLLPALAPPNYDAYAQVVIDEKVPIVETAGRNPEKFIKLFKANGVIVVHKCVSIKHALTAQRLGADAISLDGFECAGHPGEDDVPNLVLLAKGARALDIPFIASGGIGDGRQLAACLALGADGVNMGTRFMATEEAPIHPNIKRALIEGDERSTTHVMRSLKNTERVFKNQASEEFQRIEREKPGDFMAVRHLARGENYRLSFQETGDVQSSVWSAGCVMGLIDDAPSCAELLRRIVADAEEVIRGRLSSLLAKPIGAEEEVASGKNIQSRL